MQMHTIKQFGIGALIVAALCTIEAKSVMGAVHQQIDQVSGAQWGAISFMFAVLAIVAFAVAGMLKDDVRPWVQQRCKEARIVGACAIIVPTCFLASALKAENMDQRWAAYIAAGPNSTPSSYDLDQAVVADVQGDVMERREARNRIRDMRPGAVDLDLFDVELWIAAFFQGVLLFAADKLRIAAPITEAELIKMRLSERGRKAAETRKRNKDLRERGVEVLTPKRPRKRKQAQGSLL